MTSLRADTDALQASDPKFRNVATTVGNAAEQLQASLAAEGKCWGADETGQNFEKGYSPGDSEAVKAVLALATLLDNLGGASSKIAQTLKQQDQVWSDALKKLQ